MDRLVVGDASSWQEFVSTYSRLIRSRVADVARSFGFGNDVAAIDDGTAEVFGALLDNNIAALRAYAGRSSLTTYLAVISTRCATRNFARKRQRFRKQSEASALELNQSRPEADPAISALKSEEQAKIRSLLGELPDKQRLVVQLFHFEGQSYSDISQALSMPIGSVGVTLSRAEAKLRERLEPPT